jgi:small ligand-binding sensory domain FIST
MAVRIGCGLSTTPDARVGAIEAGTLARDGLEGESADLVVVFASGQHLAAPEATLEGVHEALLPERVIGCGAGGVVGDSREIEGGTAVVVWAAALDGGTAEPFHARAERLEDGVAMSGVPDLDGASAVVLLPDPYSFPTDGLLRDLAERAPGVPIIGGISSARTLDGAGALFYGERLIEAGAVGVRLDGVDVLPCVSQGAAPLGPEMTITGADGHVITSLAGRPALDKVREVVDALGERERDMVANGLLIGIVTEPGKPEYDRGDFLVRGLIGADPTAGTIAVGATVREGQVIRLHARDAESADIDLEESLDLRTRALTGGAAGALVFTCNGRGSAMFDEPDHDAGALDRALAGAPTAGFFAAGEIGPVGGESHLHGFTATVAIFGS